MFPRRRHAQRTASRICPTMAHQAGDRGGDGQSDAVGEGSAIGAGTVQKTQGRSGPREHERPLPAVRTAGEFRAGQNRPDAGPCDDALCRPDLPASLSRWPSASYGSQPHLDGLLAGYNDRSWLDDDGHPYTEDLRVTERFRGPDFGHLEIEKTLDDPKALAQKWVIPMRLEYEADTELLEYVCAENERDRSHLVGKAADDKQLEVKVAPEILKQYVGVYDLKPPTHPEDPIPIDISLDGSQLKVSLSGGASLKAPTLSSLKTNTARLPTCCCRRWRAISRRPAGSRHSPACGVK